MGTTQKIGSVVSLDNVLKWYILWYMHVIAKPHFKFLDEDIQIQEPLQTWFRTMKKGNFRDFVQLKHNFSNVDYVDGLTVFDIEGNK